jgi:mono/diheme cytochrome c family protein
VSDVVFLAITLRRVLIILNVVAVAVIILIIASRVLSLRRNPEPKAPDNLTPFFPDEDLEGIKLERVLGWSLLFTVVIAVALPVYFLVEPNRQSSATDGFEERSIEAGAVLFANPQSPDFDSTRSLLCANCHGVEGDGGSAPFTLQPEDPSCDPEAEVTADTPARCRPVQVTWRAPSLNDVLLRFSPEAVTQIITYGRPGTPMPAWGVASGEGVLNEQSINDLVNFLASIQITPEAARDKYSEELAGMRTTVRQDVIDAEKELRKAQRALANASPDEQADAEQAVAVAQDRLDAAIAWRDTVLLASNGELVFMQQCARCHTKGWSYYDPLNPGAAPPPGPMGGGAFGPNLTDGSEERQFPGADGIDKQIAFVAQGVAPNKPYGVRGIASGRMPHFEEILTEAQIQQVVEYERGL